MSRFTVTPDEHQRRLALYAAGMIDKAIGAVCGVDRTSIQSWRKKHGLKSRTSKITFTISDGENKERMTLYKRGLSDADIARILDLTPQTIFAWRKVRNLETNTNRRGTPNTGNEIVRLELYKSGSNDKEIAAAVGATPHAIYTWRQYRGLTPNKPRAVVLRSTRPESDPIYARIKRAVAFNPDPSIQLDAIQDIYLAVLEGSLKPDAIEREAKRYAGSVMNQFANRWGARSLDEEIGEDGFTLMDTLVDDDAEEAFETAFQRGIAARQCCASKLTTY